MKKIVVFDIETTGLNTGLDKLVEFSAVRLVMEEGQYVIDRTLTRLVNPGRAIPATATAIHGITDFDVKDCLPFADQAQDIYAFMNGCDLAGHNIKGFDIPFILEEFSRVGLVFPAWPCKVYDTCDIFRQVLPHTLAGAASYFLNEDYTEGHRAENDARITARVLIQQLETVTDVETIVEKASADMVDWAGKLLKREDGVIVFNIGKVKGQPVTSDKGFANWMLNNDFSSDTKAHIRKILGL